MTANRTRKPRTERNSLVKPTRLAPQRAAVSSTPTANWAQVFMAKAAHITVRMHTIFTRGSRPDTQE